jgi:hypothetical protein
MGDVPDGHVADSLLNTLRVNPADAHAQELRAVFDRLFNPADPAQTLHHYLGASALIGFLKSAKDDKPPKLWASLATHLNDYDEILYGQKLVRQQIEEFCEADGRAEAFLSSVNHTWRDALNPKVPWTNVFVACFSELADSLSMWRGYADQRGYALTFNVSAWPRDILLLRVWYGPEVSHFPTFFKALLAFYEVLRKEDRIDDKAIFETLKKCLGLVAAAYKRDEWMAEKEWRLVQWCEHNPSPEGEAHIQFRERKGRLIPYHEVKLPAELTVEAITFGPGYHSGTEMRALELARDAHLPSSVRILPTTVPLRAD